MTILAGDIKLVASEVLDDVPEGGGAPTATIINDGVSNAIFNDISELDRAGGRVNLRKVFASVQTTNRDGYFGANVIVADPPDDPRVSVTLFSTESVFDHRTDAQDRVESYLAQGPVYSGYLFGNHIAGMRVVSILQREEVALPVIGDTFVLRAFENTSGQVEQYVRVTDVSATLRTFTDDKGDFKRMQVVLDISDALRDDYPGFEALRYDASINYTGKSKFYSVIVADAANYYGIVPLEVDAAIGDYSVQAAGVFTQLVPSTRIEVPIADARMNQQAAALVKAGAPYSRALTLAFTTTQSMFIGGSILPGSLTIARGGITLTDRGGVLYDASNSQVGTIDYDNGIAALSANVFGSGSGTHSVTYTPSVTPTLVTDAIGIPVTSVGQRLSYVVTLVQIPVRKTLQVAFRAQGRWYTLTEDGTGVIRGSDTAFGAGTLSYTTGTLSVTLGALPDVDSQVIISYASTSSVRDATQLVQAGPALDRAFGKVISTGAAIKPGSLSFSWNDGTARSASDSGGVLTGAATGTVNYATGTIVFRPNLLPAQGTAISLSVNEQTTSSVDTTSFTDSGSAWTFSLGSAVEAGSVEISVIASYLARVGVTQILGTQQTVTRYIQLRLVDDGAGNLITANQTSNLTVGTINYSTGNCSITKSNAGYNTEQRVWIAQPVDSDGGGGSSLTQFAFKEAGTAIETRTLTVLNGPGAFSSAIVLAPWSWFAGVQTGAAKSRFGGGSLSAQSYPFTFDEIFLPNNPNAYTSNPSYTTKLSSFLLGTDFYVKQDTTWVSNPAPTTGVGTTAGADSVVSGAAGVLLSSWTAGVSSTPTGVAGSTNPTLSGATSLLSVSDATFRTAVSPLLNGGFSIAATWLDSGVSFTATANSSGVIATGSAPPDSSTPGSYGVFGIIDYEMGVAQVRFGRRIPDALHTDTAVLDISDLGIPGVSYIETREVEADTLRYNAVGYSYLPLDADILGLDPVRLPADGRVPIFRPGSFAVIGNTQTVGPATVSNGQTIDCARERLSRVRVIGHDGLVINSGYTANLDAGTVTFTDVSGYSQPVSIEHRIEDMMLVSDARINGQLTFTRPVTHNYPASGSYVSSALVAGDLRARVSLTFDQATWSNVFSDTVIGSAATGTYNTIANPIEITNKGGLTERWAIVFTNSTSFNVIGEHVGVIAVGNTATDLSPINPATGSPYFTIRAAGWGLGWATGNVLRLNTVGAFYPVWVVRTILQGPETVTNDSFTMLIRGDVDNPI